MLKNNIESVFAISAALLVIFTAMIDTRISVGIASALLVGYAILKYFKK